MEDHFKNQPNPHFSMPPTTDEKTWGMLAHGGFIIGGLLVPLIIYLVKKNESRFVAQNAVNALNWMLTLLVITIPLSIIMVVVMFASMAATRGGPESMLGIVPFYLLMIPLSIYNLVRGIMGMVAANRGDVGTYPMSIKFVKFR